MRYTDGKFCLGFLFEGEGYRINGCYLVKCFASCLLGLDPL